MSFGPWPDDIVTDETVTAAWLTKVSQSLGYLIPIAHEEFISPVTVSGTSATSPTDVVSSGATEYEAVPIKIEFYAPLGITGGTDGALLLNLWDDTTQLGRIAALDPGGTGGTIAAPLYGARVLTPSAGSHTYRIRAWRAGGDGSIQAGSGGNDPAYVPGWIRITRLPA